MLLAVTWISCFLTFAWVGILQNIWNPTGFSAQLDDKTRSSSVDIPLSTFIFQNFRDAEIEKCLLYIKHDAQAIELLEELLSSKLDLKITQLWRYPHWWFPVETEISPNICWKIFLSGQIQSVKEEIEDWFKENQFKLYFGIIYRILIWGYHFFLQGDLGGQAWVLPGCFKTQVLTS